MRSARDLREHPAKSSELNNFSADRRKDCVCRHFCLKAVRNASSASNPPGEGEILLNSVLFMSVLLESEFPTRVGRDFRPVRVDFSDPTESEFPTRLMYMTDGHPGISDVLLISPKDVSSLKSLIVLSLPIQRSCAISSTV